MTNTPSPTCLLLRRGPAAVHAARAALGLLLVLATVAAHAQLGNTVAAHVKINDISLNWRVNADSSSVYELTVQREALSDQGAQMISKYARIYNKALEDHEVLTAYTLKPDGRRIPVENDGFQLQSGVASGGTGPSWPGAMILSITFPEVRKGDRTVWTERLTRHTPLLPGWVTLSEALQPAFDTNRFTATLDAPKSLGLNVFASGLQMTTEQQQDRQIWRVSGQNTARVMDDNAANMGTSLPRLLASTFRDQTQLGDAFARQFNTKVVVTDDVRNLAQTITQGASSPGQKAAAVHNWIRKNIRYVAVYLGTGGWVPHDVGWILKNRYGDCKDQVLLMVTLLKAVDIEAAPVLISTGSDYELDELPVGFNHAIVYLPGLKQFADPTDTRIPPGALPQADADKPVIVALKEGSAVMRTPAFTAQANRMTVRTRLAIDRDGNAKGTLQVESFGESATRLQDRLNQIPPGMADIALRKILNESGLRGRGTLQFDPVQREVQSQSLTISNLTIENLLSDASAGSINPHPAVNLPIYIWRNMDNYTAESRQDAYTCIPVTVREEFELSFDTAFKLLHIPPDIQKSGPDAIRFQAHYSQTGNTVTGWREMDLTQPRHVCSPADFEQRQPLMRGAIRNLRGVILFVQKGA